MTYQARDFWDRRLSEHFDLRGTGETGLPLAYNRACYALRREVLDAALAAAAFDPRDKRVLDVGPGSGFWVDYYLARGAQVTGIDIAPIAVAKLGERFPTARFVLGDVGEVAVEGRYDLVNAFDVLYHITDDRRWARALDHLATAVEPGGLLVITEIFGRDGALAEHNRVRSLATYRATLEGAGFRIEQTRPTHVLLNQELGAFRFLNRAPGLLLVLDRALLPLGVVRFERTNTLLVARKLR